MTGVVPLPAGIAAEGVKLAVAPLGNPVVVNDTALAVVVFAGTSVKLKSADWPATTEALEVDEVILKSSTINARADVVPPPGLGLFTVMLNVPLCAKSLARRAALSEVELT